MEKLPLFVQGKKYVAKYSHEALTAAYDRHFDMIYRICYTLMGNVHDTEDAVQSVFIKLFNSKMCFSDIEHEKAWLIKVAQNQCRDYHKQWWRKKVTFTESTKEHAVHTRESNPVLDEVMALPKNLRVALYLYYYEGYKQSEIATLLGININTVKTRIRRGKQCLKIKLGENMYGK